MTMPENNARKLRSVKYSRIFQTRVYAIVFYLAVVLVSVLYLRFAWNRYQKITSTEAMMLAQSLESLLRPEHIAELTGSAGDIGKHEYVAAKANLMRLTETTNPIRFAYLMGERDGSLVILLDSESPDSPDFSPPGQVYEEADNIFREPFQSGKAILTKPITDRWGTWISALVPVKDQQSERVLAVFGIDYSASEWFVRLWERMIPDVIIVIFMLMVLFALHRSQIHNLVLKEKEESLRESERSKAVLLANLPGMAYRCCYDREWTMQFVSAGCYKLTGFSPDNLLFNKDLSFNDIIAHEYRDLLWNEWERILARHLPFRFEYEITTAGGERKWVLEMGEGVYNTQGEVEALEGIVLDISDRKSMENHLRYTNEHDLWTGLYNRRYLEGLMKHDAEIACAGNRAVIGVNLSTVHMLSLAYGFHYKQDLIKKAAEALNLLCIEGCALFNTYENRFVYYLSGYQDQRDLTAFCKAVVCALESVFTVDRIGGGIGIVEITEENKRDIDRILKNLLIASERAIKTFDGNFGFCFYDAEMESQILREETIRLELAQIAAAEGRDKLFLEFQPIMDLKTNLICGFEALARFDSDGLGIVPPSEFIPIAEESKLIIPLGKEIFAQALHFINDLAACGYHWLTVSINVSGIQLLKNGFVSELLEMIDQMHVNPANISLEITESVFAINYQEINNILGELEEHGIKIAIDDFGTEYSSLARERELNVNCLKIAKSFIDKLLTLPDEEAITADIISMAHKLGHIVVAEGVEHEKQIEYLRRTGCDKVQGYLIGKPMDKRSAIQLLGQQSGLRSQVKGKEDWC